MKLRELGELGFVRRLRQRQRVLAEGVVRGIGDDAAVFATSPGRLAVVSTDLLVEGVHFRLGHGDPRCLGAKAMAVNLSDIAAMGARPRQAFLALAAPGAMAVAVLDAVLEGFEEEGRRHGTALLGGDSCTSPGPLVLAVTVIGEGEPGKLVFRDGSRPGDVIYSTGTLGDAAAGLLLLERGCELDGDDRRALVAAHLSPHAALDEGEWLAASGAVTAMIDLSDGLATDLRHLLDESGGLGAVVEAERVALSAALKAVSFELDEDPLALAFTGGEDYRLLLTVQPERAGELEAAYRLRFASPLVELGRVTGDGRLQLRRGGQLTPLEGHGFEHWRA